MILSQIYRQYLVNCSPTDHFVRLHPSPYEEPTCTQKWKATAHVQSNPLAPSIDELPYAESQFNAPGNNTHSEFNSDITSKEEYDTTVHLVCNSQHKVKLNILSIPALYNPVLHFPQNTILFGQYSMLCEHYYKILEQVYIYIYICTDNWYNILIYVFSSSIGCKGISELW